MKQEALDWKKANEKKEKWDGGFWFLILNVALTHQHKPAKSANYITVNIFQIVPFII